MAQKTNIQRCGSAAGRTWLFISLILLSILAVSSTALAAEVSVTAELNSKTFSLNQAATLTVTVNNAGSATPEMPVAEGLRFIYRGQSSQSQWINGKTSSSVSFTFMVQAEKEGKHTINPIRVKVDNKTYTTQKLTCTVLAASSGRTAVQSGSRSGAPAARLRSGDADKIGFLRIYPKEKTIYSGQLVPFTVKAYFRQGMRVTLKSNPAMVGENFMLHSLDEQPTQREITLKGDPYVLLTWQGTLSAVKEGTFPLVVEMDAELLVREQSQRRNSLFGSPFMNDPFMNDPFFDDFFGQYSRRQVKMASPKQDITVQDLPVKGRPADFNGAIGLFSLAVSADPLKGKVGDPITLKMKITGKGNFDMVQAPVLTDQQGWKSYPASENLEDGNRSSRTKRFEQAIVPTRANLTAIPSLQFSYFDPEAKQYVTLNSDPIGIELSRGTAPVVAPRPDRTTAAEPAPAPDAQVTDNNLAPLHTEAGKLVQDIRPLYGKSWFFALMVMALLCLLAALVLYQRRKRHEADPGILLHKQVATQLKHHFAAMEEAISSQNSTSFRSHCQAAIRKRLAEIRGQEPGSITLADLQQLLPVDSPLLTIFTRLEQIGYAGGSLSTTAMEEILQTTKTELDKLS
jgi:hypothetical protein